MEAVILAGGLGTRLRSVVSDVPKPMAPVNGRPFLEHLIEYWIRQGVQRFILSVGYRHEKIQRHFGTRYGHAGMDYAVEREPLGTGGGFLLALEQVTGDRCLVLNGDTFFEVPLRELDSEHDNGCAVVTLSLFEAPPGGRYLGVDLAEDGEVRRFGVTAAQGKTFCNGGVYMIARNAFAGMAFRPGEACSLESDLLTGLRQHGGLVRGFVSHGFFIDIGVPEDYLRAQALFSGGNQA